MVSTRLEIYNADGTGLQTQPFPSTKLDRLDEGVE